MTSVGVSGWMVRAAVVAALGVGLWTATVARIGAQAPAAVDVPDIQFEKYTLPNGLEVILSEDHRLPLTAVNVWYHVGPANEEPGRTGFAHLFEHMMFNGSKHVPGDSHFKFIEGAGATDFNGTTGFDRTNYFETLPSNQLELGLWLESDRMGYLLDTLTPAALANQQDVVRNERRQSYESRPYGIVSEAVFHTLFPKGHPYYANIIGSHADIQSAQLDDVKGFFKKYYSPANATLAIVGDIDKAKTKALVEKYFGPLKSGPKVPKPSVTTPPITSERRVTVTDRIQLPRLYMAWLSPKMYTQEDADADVAGNALGGGRFSRLYRSLVYEKQIAQDVAAYQQSMMLVSSFMIQATARPGHTLEELEAAIDAEVTRLQQEGPEAWELELARNGSQTNTVRGLERLGGFGGIADQLNDYNHYLGDPGFLRKDLQRYQNVTPERVKAFARTLTKDSRVVVYGMPGTQDLGPEVPSSGKVADAAGAGDAVNADAPWRNTKPAAAPLRPLTVPVPVSFTLSNGLTVLLNERSGVPLVSAALVFKTGSSANPAGKPGLANFTAAMLDQGTATRSAQEIAQEAARLGSSLRTQSTVDVIQVSTSALTRTFPQMLTLLADVVRHPAFPAAEVERQRTSRLAQLVQQRENTTAIASTVTAAALYGPAHPYGSPEIGTEASNRAMTVDDLRAFWQRNGVPNNAALVVSGRIVAAELRALAERAFGDWQRGTPDVPASAVPQTTKARVVLVDKPGAPQSQLRAVSVAAPRTTPDYEAMRVMNDVLGGLFSSRLNLNLREDHGYTYGANSQFAFRKMPGFFVAASAVRTDVTAPALGEMVKEIGKMRDGITPDELTLARDAIVRALPSDFETSSSASSTTSSLFLYGFPLNYFVGAPARFASVTVDQATAAARKYLVPDQMLYIVVGDRAKIGADIEKLNLGPIEVWTPDGVRATP